MPVKQEVGVAPNPRQVAQGTVAEWLTVLENLENPFAFIDSNENIFPAGGLWHSTEGQTG